MNAKPSRRVAVVAVALRIADIERQTRLRLSDRPFASLSHSSLASPVPTAMLIVNKRIAIPDEELAFTYVRSSGPGGQNVNKVNSKAVLRWNVAANSSVPADVRERFAAAQRRRITTGGEIVLSSDRYRDQARNAADCLDKLKAMLAEVATPPKKRRPTKPGKAARERRLKTKSEQSQKKQARQKKTWD